jgi:hypothetical protein
LSDREMPEPRRAETCPLKPCEEGVGMPFQMNRDDEIVHDIDKIVGEENRDAFIASSFRKALGEEVRWHGMPGSVGVESRSDAGQTERERPPSTERVVPVM